jgi:hypothetical protein
MSQQHTPGRDRADLIEWLLDRQRNCERLASTKRGDDAAGWKEDADYFRRAAEALAQLDKANAQLFEQGQKLYAQCEAMRPSVGELKKCVAMLIEIGGAHMDHKPIKFREAILDYAKSGGAAITKASEAATKDEQ